MDGRNLIHPMTAGDLVESACILAVQERGDGVEVRILECTGLETHDHRWDTPAGAHRHPAARATASFRDRHTGLRIQLELKASTPLLFTRISI